MKAAVAALVLVLAPAIASADVLVTTGAPGSGQTVAQPFVAPAPPKKSPIDQRQDVVASGRGLAAPTAITVPAGQVELTMQSLIPFAALAGLNAGLTSTTEVWVEGATAFVEDAGGEYGAGIKQSLVRTRNLALAVTGSMRKFTDGGSGNKLLGIGGVATLCVDDGCALELSGSLARIWGFNESDYDTNGPGANLITVSASVGNATTRFLVEAMTVDGDTIGFLGLRFGNKKWAMDLAVVRPFDDGDMEVPALPWIGASARL